MTKDGKLRLYICLRHSYPTCMFFLSKFCLMCFVVTVWTYFFSIFCGIQGDQWAEISWSRKDGSVDRKVSHLKRSQIFHQNLQSNHKPNMWRASRVSHGGKATARMHRTLAINVPPYREKETTWNNRIALVLLVVELEWRHLTHLTRSTIYDWIRSHFRLWKATRNPRNIPRARCCRLRHFAIGPKHSD